MQARSLNLKQILAAVTPKMLGTRLALTYSFLVLFVVVALGFSLTQTIRGFYLGWLKTELIEESAVAGDIVNELVANGASTAEIDQALRRLGDELNVRLTLIAPDGEVLADSQNVAQVMDNHWARPEVRDAVRTGIGSATRQSATEHVPFFYVATVIDPNKTVIRLSVPTSVVEHLIDDVEWQIGVAAFTAGILMAGAGLFVARRVTKALNELRKQAAAVAAGQLDVLVDPSPTQELGDLGRAFNTMTTTLRETVTQLEQTRTRLEATLADLSDGVVISDERGHVLLANDAAREMLGAGAVAQGTPFFEVGRDHELSELMERALASKNGRAESIVHHVRSGKTLQAAARGLDAAEERIGVLVLRDLTELRRLESVRRDFVANVSHELRTPLTSIRALVETLEAGAVNDPEVSGDFLHRIISEVERLTTLVDELLDLARLESGRMSLRLAREDAEDLVLQAASRLSPQTERAGLTISWDIASDVAAIRCDRERIGQVLLNLIHNAIKFTPSGGSIHLSVAQIGPDAEFRVEDTGIGVLPDDIPRLFERFYKTDRARRSVGTGLGLAIAKHIVMAHGGTIWAEHNRPTGTVFIFRLPVDGPDDSGSVPESEPRLAETVN